MLDPLNDLTSVIVGAVLAAVVATVFTVLGTIASRREASKRRDLVNETPLETKIALIAVTSGELSRLNREIQDEFKVQLAETERLKREAEDAKGIAALNDEALKAAQSLIGSTYAKTVKGDRRFQVIVAAVSFVLGIGATVAVSLIFQALFG